MDLRGVAKELDQVFSLILVVVLVLFSFMHLFVFIINWEGWFFGIRIAGLNAGIVLFAYFLASAVLAYLLFRYPRRMAIIALLSIFLFSFRFIDSAATIQALSGGKNSFSGFLAALVVIPLVVLVGHIIVSRFYDHEESIKEDRPENRTISEIIGIEETDENTIKTILALAIAAVVVVFLFGQVIIIPGILLLLLFLVLLAVKRRYDAKKSGREIKGQITGRDRQFIMAVFAIMFLVLLAMVAVFFLLISS